MTNYDTYLSRMTTSMSRTTKNLIPIYAANIVNTCKNPRILEVGIGSGCIGIELRHLIPNAHITGIDINRDNINNFNNTYTEEDKTITIYNSLVTTDFMKFNLVTNEPFDLIIFASVIHEIGSYTEEEYRFNAYATLDAIFNHSAELLAPNGKIIIRDGILDAEYKYNQIDSLYVTDIDTVIYFVKFINEFKGYSVEDNLVIEEDAITITVSADAKYYNISAPCWIIKEFLCTYTWGEQSWHREIQERFCYASKNDYELTLKNNHFKLITELYTAEEYCQYFKKIVPFPDDYTDIIGLFIAEKEVDIDE